jgi:hypothetical protein
MLIHLEVGHAVDSRALVPLPWYVGKGGPIVRLAQTSDQRVGPGKVAIGAIARARIEELLLAVHVNVAILASS